MTRRAGQCSAYSAQEKRNSAGLTSWALATRTLWTLRSRLGCQKSRNPVSAGKRGGGQVQILPDKTLQDVPVIGHPIEDFGCRDAIGREQRNKTAIHLASP